MVRHLTAVAALALAAFGAAAADKVFEKAENGTPAIKGIDAIAFGPEGTLLIGDSKGAQVVAIATKDTATKKRTATAVEKFDEKIADKLGTTAAKIEFVGMAVNPASGTAYVAVKTGGKSVVVTVDAEGKIGEFVAEKVDHVAIPLPNTTTQITDLAWTKDRILVGGASKETFGSKVITIPTPLDSTKKASGFSAETYHVAHGKWETKAPMMTLVPLEQKGKQYVVGAFKCTPIVRYPLEEIKDGSKVKGTSFIELGHGNQPRGMFSYAKGDKSYLLVNNFRMDFAHKSSPIGKSQYWVARVDMAVFDETTKVNEKAEWRVEKGTAKQKDSRASVVEAFTGTRYMDRLGDKHAVLIQEDGKSGFTFAVRELP